MFSSSPVTERMQCLVRQWEQQQDNRSVFLGCYHLMTLNMLGAIQAAEFYDPPWVETLLQRFAQYYFAALEAYESSPDASPAIWRLTFDAALQPDTQVLQNLLLGVNAHINYDLIFTLVEMLEMEWRGLNTARRERRYQDHCHVNEVIHRTVDAVQDMVIEPRPPAMDILDRLMGPVDEWAISRLISHWRDQVWQDAVRMLEATDEIERMRLSQLVETEALQRGRIILRL